MVEIEVKLILDLDKKEVIGIVSKGVEELAKKLKTDRDFLRRRDELLTKISTEGHSFPHYWTCNTCLDDFDRVFDFIIEEIEKEARKR